jgi:DNA-binding NarL/FixJ family response regulator
MVVTGVLNDAPILVHLFDDVALAAHVERNIEAVSDALGRGGAEIVSNRAEESSVSQFDLNLTARELEVLRLVSLGWDTQRIADYLDISYHTARNHIRHFRQKLNASTKMDAVLAAIRMGILSIERPE